MKITFKVTFLHQIVIDYVFHCILYIGIYFQFPISNYPNICVFRTDDDLTGERRKREIIDLAQYVYRAINKYE